ALWRWREVLAGGGTAALGLWWSLGTTGLLPWLGGVLVLAGAALVAAGVQRARFRGAAGGPGVVRVDEGQIAYFGPLTGGVIALSEMSTLALDRGARPPHWVLSQPGHDELRIPLNAEGAEALFDVFASLPGLRTERMLAEMHRDSAKPVVIWRQPDNDAARLARPH
ncbi:hypothetical protein, partial [Roseovarius salis]|uniref:hypothetical protein n=1 Tax=Roseovarius salis TaxID=3376063 RepID=UPI0037CB7890